MTAPGLQALTRAAARGPRPVAAVLLAYDAAYVAFARRLTTAKPGDIFSAYIVPGAEVGVTVAAIATREPFPKGWPTSSGTG